MVATSVRGQDQGIVLLGFVVAICLLDGWRPLPGLIPFVLPVSLLLLLAGRFFTVQGPGAAVTNSDPLSGF